MRSNLAPGVWMTGLLGLALATACRPGLPTDDDGAQGESDTQTSVDAGAGESGDTQAGSETGPNGETDEPPPDPPGPEDYPQCDCGPEELCIAECADVPGFPPPGSIPCTVYCLPRVEGCPAYATPDEYCEHPECLPPECAGQCDPSPVIPAEYAAILGYDAFCRLL